VGVKPFEFTSNGGGGETLLHLVKRCKASFYEVIKSYVFFIQFGTRLSAAHHVLGQNPIHSSKYRRKREDSKEAIWSPGSRNNEFPPPAQSAQGRLNYLDFFASLVKNIN